MKLWKFAHNHFHSRGTPLQVFRSLSSIRLIFWFQIRTKVASKTHFEDQFDKYRALKFQFEIITKMRNGPCKRYWKILFFLPHSKYIWRCVLFYHSVFSWIIISEFIAMETRGGLKMNIFILNVRTYQWLKYLDHTSMRWFKLFQ